jgi:hypothetical protein
VVVATATAVLFAWAVAWHWRRLVGAAEHDPRGARGATGGQPPGSVRDARGVLAATAVATPRAVASAGDLGRPWQWAAAAGLALSIALGWGAWRGTISGPGRLAFDGPIGAAATPVADRRAVLTTALAEPARASRIAALGESAGRATRVPISTHAANPPPPAVPPALAPGLVAGAPGIRVGAPPAGGVPARATALSASLASGRATAVALEAQAQLLAAVATSVADPATLAMRELAPAEPGRLNNQVSWPPPSGPLPFRGMGYQPTYATAEVAPHVRAELLIRDLRLMRDVGINLVLGWDPGIFDERLVVAAEASDISVIMPFDLRPEWNYADPALRSRVLADLATWVTRYRTHPAIVIWGVGNEVTLEMSPVERDAFAEFYVQAFELVRRLDPTRPVTLREAEDVFAPHLTAAFARRQGIALEVAEGDRRPVVIAPEGFIYGVNFYTDRVGPVLNDWVQTTGLDAPLFVSEYAPAGMSRAQRPGGFAHMYGLILAAGPRVVGSAPYTWTTAGPEAVDAYFGLVDPHGRPTDGTLSEVARMYGVQPPGWVNEFSDAEEIALAAELPRLLGEAALTVARILADDPEEVLGRVDRLSQQADGEMGLGPEPTLPEDPGSQRVRAVARLIGWARELSELRGADGSTRLFPGMREALPLLKGMARWSRHEQSAVDTARDFMATVLRRDLAVLGVG